MIITRPRVDWVLDRLGSRSGGTGAVGLSEGVPAPDQGDSLAVVHVHTVERVSGGFGQLGSLK